MVNTCFESKLNTKCDRVKCRVRLKDRGMDEGCKQTLYTQAKFRAGIKIQAENSKWMEK
jgi:hypothetical protein